MITSNNIDRLIATAQTQVLYAYSRHMKVKAMNKLCKLEQTRTYMIANGNY